MSESDQSLEEWLKCPFCGSESGPTFKRVDIDYFGEGAMADQIVRSEVDTILKCEQCGHTLTDYWPEVNA